jgi:RNA polymerase sigma factor (sigma-70 family)
MNVVPEPKRSPMPATAAIQSETIGQTVRKEGGRLRNFIRRRVANRDDADDILQEVYYQFVAVTELGTIEKAASWLYKVATNKITDWYRKKKSIPVSTLKAPDYDAEGDAYSPGVEDLLFDPEQIPDYLLLQSEVWPLVEEALEELPYEQRDVFIMHELEDLSFNEISEITGVPLNTLLSRKRYAVQVLREKLRDVYNEFINEF